MLIDLTQPVLHILVDECPEALVIRTLTTAKHPEHGHIKSTDAHIPDFRARRDVSTLFDQLSDDRFATLAAGQRIAAGATLNRGTSTCIETALPLSWARSGETGRFEVTTLARHKEGYQARLYELRLVRDKVTERWTIGVYSGPNLDEIAALSARRLTRSSEIDFPIHRVGKENANRAAKFADELEHFRESEEIWGDL